MRPPLIKVILLAGVVVGTLDIAGTLMVYSVLLHKMPAIMILRRIASAALGQTALSGGWTMAWCGLFFHYVIAFCFTTAYVLLYPYLSFLQKNKYISGVLYGLLVWLIMNRIVLPLTKIHMATFQWSTALIGMALLIFFIGLPVAYITDAYYKKNERITADLKK